MRTIALALTLLAATGVARADEPKTASPAADPMAGWKPRKVARAKQDRKEIRALFKAMEDAGRKGDLEAAAALIDFPVLMVTDDSKGEAEGDAWTREKWTQVMAPFYKPMPKMKVTHKPNVFLLTDSIATISDEWTMTMGKKKVSGRSATLVVRRGGTWLVKSMAEGGWGDMMQDNAPAASAQEVK